VCVGLAARTLQRWRRDPGVIKADARRRAHRSPESVRTPANRLSPAERAELLAVADAPEFADLSPHRIVPALADRGRYIASESTFYRVLRTTERYRRRGRAKAPARERPAPLRATGPNPVWSWDITYLRTTVRGLFFYLYLIMDVYSRKIVGWEVYAEESAEQAAGVFRKAHLREGIGAAPLFLHADNGSPMKGGTMLATLHRLGVTPSFSRPSVSDDNPYSEALFKTLKYHPSLPERPFEDLADARAWIASFVGGYNGTHRHSGIKFVTPDQRHRREDVDLLARRQALYQAARAKRPERWTGPTRNWEPATVVILNPGKPTRQDAPSDALAA
jgi:putative transposase